MSQVDYALLCNVTFEMPALPPVDPVYPPAATQHQTSAADRVHTKQWQIYNKDVTVEQALKKHLTEVFERNLSFAVSFFSSFPRSLVFLLKTGLLSKSKGQGVSKSSFLAGDKIICIGILHYLFSFLLNMLAFRALFGIKKWCFKCALP